ncbi:MAG: hypothetical protein RP166_6650 [Rapeseed phyllody phytoplasma]|uniref:Uncharacterized protein n=1 Tax=Rapeseed phyllody phytoplasma TaxID=2490543 RepID=A0A859I9V8_9MOLU|nr:MAG: hypothetical protein RP166_6650 [Rapeseed phyllody phytoplasma]
MCSLQNLKKPFCIKNAPKKLIYVYQKDIDLSKYGYGNNTHSIEDLKNSRLGIKNLYLFWLKDGSQAEPKQRDAIINSSSSRTRQKNWDGSPNLQNWQSQNWEDELEENWEKEFQTDWEDE